MIHELKKLIQAHQEAEKAEMAAVLATVVALEGSSYRRPGVRMLMLSNGRMVGAVSGGCVEKEIWRQAQDVFETGIPKMMTYDGRYRLGCEGILHILIEPFSPSKEFIQGFWSAVQDRKEIVSRSFFTPDAGSRSGLGSVFLFNQEWKTVHGEIVKDENLQVFEQKMEPCHRLFIVGAEHDAVQLSYYASLTGWEVSVVASPSEEKSIQDFPGASDFFPVLPESLDISGIDRNTSVILMTHSYVKDLAYLIRIKDTSPGYLGLLGPAKRREKLLDEFLERYPETGLEFVENIHGPAGLDIGAETPQEIAISIISEILSVYRNTLPSHLKDRSGAIHSS